MSFKVGERVQGNYKGVGVWYPGKIASIASGLGGALFTINYDDGDVESVPASRVQRPSSFKVGDVIEGNYQGFGSFYLGKIAAGPNDEGNYSINYDDGDKEKNVNPSLIRIPKALQTYKAGESVEGNYQNFGVWYPGVVVKVYQLKLKSVFDVDYDDGDKEKAMPAERLRRRVNDKPVELLFKVGDRIESNFKGYGNYFPGVISRLGPGNFYAVRYDDGDREDRVAPTRVRAAPTLADAEVILKKMSNPSLSKAEWKTNALKLTGMANSPYYQQGLADLGIFNLCAAFTTQQITIEYMSLLNIIGDFSKTKNYAEMIIETDAYLPLIRVLKDDRYAWNDSNQISVKYLAISSIMNLTQWSAARPALKTAGLLSIIHDGIPKTKGVERIVLNCALIFLAGADEYGKGRDLLEQHKGAINDVIECLNVTLQGKGGRGYVCGSVTLAALIGALRTLATGDVNKQAMMQGGVIPLFAEALRQFVHQEESKSRAGGGADDSVSAAKAVEGLLSLSFPNSQNIEQEGEEVCGKSQFESSDVKALLVLFIESDKKDIPVEARRSASSLLRRLAPNKIEQASFIEEEMKLETAGADIKKHVMISYSWSQKQLAISLTTGLRKAGLEVWRDEDGSAIVGPMAGNTDEVMAAAVENSSVFVMLVSPQYKQSANCQAEAKYAQVLRKKKKLKVIFVMCDKNYTTETEVRCDGWLGFMVGGDLWYGGYDTKNHREIVDAVSKAFKNPDPQRASPPPSAPPLITRQRSATVFTSAFASASQLTIEEVCEWLKENGLIALQSAFLEGCVDGHGLVALKDLLGKRDSPEDLARFLGFLKQDLLISSPGLRLKLANLLRKSLPLPSASLEN